MKLVILSGGVDSSTCLAMAKEKDKDVRALTFNYQQKHSEMEIEASKKISNYYKVEQKIIDLSNLFDESKSSLSKKNDAEIPEEEYKSGIIPSTEVEFRNGLFLSIATSIALQIGADEIYYGAHSNDDGAIYPDCSDEFISYLSKTIQIGTNNRVKLITPFKGKIKSDIVREGIRLKVPYELTYSCYKGGEEECGKCATCLDKIKAFRDNGIELV